MAGKRNSISIFDVASLLAISMVIFGRRSDRPNIWIASCGRAKAVDRTGKLFRSKSFGIHELLRGPMYNCRLVALLARSGIDWSLFSRYLIGILILTRRVSSRSNICWKGQVQIHSKNAHLRITRLAKFINLELWNS